MKLSWIRVDPKSCKDVCPYKRQKRRHTEIEVKATGRWWQTLEGSHKNTKDYQHSPEAKRVLEWTLSQNFHKEPTLLTPS